MDSPPGSDVVNLPLILIGFSRGALVLNQLLSELGRGAIQGVSQYISKKMREEKVHLKSGYTLMLYQNNQ